MANIFLSHSHADKEFTRKLANDLRREGHIVWIDEAEIKIGDSLIEKIREGIDKVDYVAAILSEASIKSKWVTQELDLASNRQIAEGRVIVLPLLVEDVVLPGFLLGKRYANFKNPEKYDESFKDLLNTLGPVEKPPELNQTEIQKLKQALQEAHAFIKHNVKEQERQQRLISSRWSHKLREAVDKANKSHPEHKSINEVYAFEVSNIPVTLDYLLWAIAKSMHQGSHPLAALLALDDKWDDAELMLSAYEDLINSY